MLLIGGSDANGPGRDHVEVAASTPRAALTTWAEEKRLDVAADRRDRGRRSATTCGCTAARRVRAGRAVQRGTIAKPAAGGPPANPEAGKVSDWVSDPVWNLPGQRIIVSARAMVDAIPAPA